MLPKTLKHSEITSGLKWRLEDLLTPERPEPIILDDIIEYKSGTIEVSFTPLRRTNSLRLPKSASPSLARRHIDNSAFSIPRRLQLRGIRIDPIIPVSEYEIEQPSPSGKEHIILQLNQR